jgi:hypothetical protein
MRFSLRSSSPMRTGINGYRLSANGYSAIRGLDPEP